MRVKLLLQSAFAAVSLLSANAHPIGYYPRDDDPTISSTPCGPAWAQQAYKNGVVVSRNGINYKSLIFIKETDAAPGDNSWKWSIAGACTETELIPAGPSAESTSSAVTGSETTQQIDDAVSEPLSTVAPDTAPSEGSFDSVISQEFGMYLPPVPPQADQCAPLWTPQLYALNETVSWGSHNYNSAQPIPDTDTQAPGMDETKWTLVGPCLNGPMPLLSDMPGLDTSQFIPFVSQANNATVDAASILSGPNNSDTGIPSAVADVETPVLTSTDPIGVKGAKLDSISLITEVSEGAQATDDTTALLSEPDVSNVADIETGTTPTIPEPATTQPASMDPEGSQSVEHSGTLPQPTPDASNPNTNEVNASLITPELPPGPQVQIKKTDIPTVNSTETEPALVAAELEVHQLTPIVAEVDNKRVEHTLLSQPIIDHPIVGGSEVEVVTVTPKLATMQVESVTTNGASDEIGVVTPSLETTQLVPVDTKIGHDVKGSSSLPQPEPADPSVDTTKVDNSPTIPDALPLPSEDTNQSIPAKPDVANQPMPASVGPGEVTVVENPQPRIAGASSGNVMANSNTIAPEFMAPQFAAADVEAVNAVPEAIPLSSVDVQQVENVVPKELNGTILVKGASGRTKRKPTVKKAKHTKEKPKWTRKQKKGKYTKRPKKPTKTKPHSKPTPKTTEKKKL
ncbi:hypothetical protein BJ741DRAFT_645567 [Chytriomyces cf. hyalinus JEL632]|nr:hypothetical protein BJ741DRAFT_645567 [Chytriomyces cf. hyalinus JEL632]